MISPDFRIVPADKKSEQDAQSNGTPIHACQHTIHSALFARNVVAFPDVEVSHAPGASPCDRGPTYTVVRNASQICAHRHLPIVRISCRKCRNFPVIQKAALLLMDPPFALCLYRLNGIWGISKSINSDMFVTRE